uniref:Uncharacterized protein n=1 Tax=Panagrolaimus sp. ES5 TaxID=591445 RepID=A0AC34FC54_9BILA
MNLMIIFLVLVSLLLPNSAAFILEPNAARDYGKIFQVTLKSKDKIELVADGKIPPRLSPTIISNELNFEKYNETHLGIVFYAIIKDLANQKCSYHFHFPDYIEFKAKRFLPTPPSSLPSGNATPLQIPATSTPKSDKSGSEETKTSSTLIYVCAAVASLLLGIIISGIASYFLLPKLSYFKPPNNDDATKIDAEKTKFVNLDETKQTKTISKAENNTTTKQQTLNGIPTIDSYNGGRTTGNA